MRGGGGKRNDLAAGVLNFDDRRPFHRNRFKPRSETGLQVLFRVKLSGEQVGQESGHSTLPQGSSCRYSWRRTALRFRMSASDQR